MKKLTITILFALIVKLSFCEDIKSSFYIKVIDADPSTLEEICIKHFGDSFSYGNASKVFSLEATGKERLAFFEEIKKAGMLINSSSERDAYELSIKKNEENKGKKYTINSGFFKANELLSMQNIFGESIKGDRFDEVFILDKDIAKIKLALEDLGYESTFSAGQIFIKKIEYSFEIEYPEKMKEDILPILETYAGKTQILLNTIRINITMDNLLDAVDELESKLMIKKIDLDSTQKILISERDKFSYPVAIYVSSKLNAKKLINAFSSSEKFKIEDSFINEEAGTMHLSLNILTYSENQDEIMDFVSKKARATIPALRLRDIKISAPKN